MRRPRDWNEDYIYSLSVQEYDNIEFKASALFDLEKSVREKTRAYLAKQICALANSGGGMLVIGVKDPKSCKNGILEIDGGVLKEFGTTNTIEWLNANISTLVDFELQRFEVHAVESKESHSAIHVDKAVYVIEIPDSELAPHQNQFDKKYYIRNGGNSLPASHRMVMDIAGRQKTPLLKVEFAIVINPYHSPIDAWTAAAISTSDDLSDVRLRVTARNVGRIYAQYVNVDVFIPRGCFDQQDDELKHELEYRTVATRQNIDYLNFSLTNNDIKIVLPGQLSSSWFDPTSPGPILPGREHHWNIRLRNNWMLRRQTSTYHSVIEWTVNADNAVQMHDEIYLKDIDVLDNRKKV